METQIPAVETVAAQEESVNLRHYWHVILERRWLVITAFISIFVLSLIYLFKATPIYQATPASRSITNRTTCCASRT